MTHSIMVADLPLVNFDDRTPEDPSVPSIYTPARGLSYEQGREEITIPIRGNDGILLAYSRGTFEQFTFQEVLIYSKDAVQRKAYKMSILDSLDLARLWHLTKAGAPVDYYRGLGGDDYDPDIYEIVTGKWREPTSELLSAGILQGELVLICTRT